MGGSKINFVERDLRPVVRPVSKGRFRTLLSVSSNFATLILHAAVMQQRASTWVDFISPCGYHSLYIYNKVYARNGDTLFAYICGGKNPWIHKFIDSWIRQSGIDHAVACEYIITDVGRLDVAYPYLEAMRRPEVRDRRGETYSHVFFVSIILLLQANC